MMNDEKRLADLTITILATAMFFIVYLIGNKDTGGIVTIILQTFGAAMLAIPMLKGFGGGTCPKEKRVFALVLTLLASAFIVYSIFAERLQPAFVSLYKNDYFYIGGRRFGTKLDTAYDLAVLFLHPCMVDIITRAAFAENPVPIPRFVIAGLQILIITVAEIAFVGPIGTKMLLYAYGMNLVTVAVAIGVNLNVSARSRRFFIALGVSFAIAWMLMAYPEAYAQKSSFIAPNLLLPAPDLLFAFTQAPSFGRFPGSIPTTVGFDPASYLLYNLGGVPFAIYMLLALCFVIAAGRLCIRLFRSGNLRYFRHPGVFSVACIHLILHLTGGLAGTLGLFPIDVRLPFSSSFGFFGDLICALVIIIAIIHEGRIEKARDVKLNAKADRTTELELLDEKGEIYDRGKPANSLYESVRIINRETGETECGLVAANGYILEENGLHLIPFLDDEEQAVTILAYDGNSKWSYFIPESEQDMRRLLDVFSDFVEDRCINAVD